MPKNLVVTGALGHIGSAFIHSLRPGDFGRVTLIDDLSAQRYCSLFNLPKGVEYHFIEGDICTLDLRSLLKGADALVHLAAATDAVRSLEAKEQYQRVNVDGTERVARACLEVGVKLFFPSSTSVYGTQAALVDEGCDESELKPQSPYADSKLQGERLLAMLGSKGLEFVACRLGTIFGPSPGMRFHTAVNKFIWQACTGQPITVWRTALHQKRPYLDVQDAVRAVRFLIERDVFDRRIYNVVTANATVNDIVEAIKVHVPTLRVEMVDSAIMNQLSYEVSAERFTSLGFHFNGDLRRGIADSVALLEGTSATRRGALV